MNQESVKDTLLRVCDTQWDFSVVFTGKKSKKVNGLYKSESREILLHNKNFDNDNQLLYTAIHEYTHHLESERCGGYVSARCHNSAFWARFHSLLEKAEELGVYRIGFEDSPELAALTEKIKNHCLLENGRIMKEFGALLIEAQKLCQKAGIRFEDYIDRVLTFPRAAAKTVMRMSGMDIDPSVGYETMKLIAASPNAEKRREAERQIKAGKSPDSVRALARAADSPREENPASRLEKEKNRLEKTIEMLQTRLRRVNESLTQLNEDANNRE